MKIRIDTDGGTETIELTMDLEELTMRESVRLEEILGPETFEAMLSGSIEESQMMRPSFIRAVLFTKLKTLRPELELEGFDVDLDEVLSDLGGEIPLPKVEEPSSA